MKETMNNRIVITGASSGIGEATAYRLANDGYQVCITARRGKLLQQILDKLPGKGHISCEGDMADSQFAKRLAEKVGQHWEYIDAIVHCAGICESSDVINSPLDTWRTPLDGMINGAVYLTRALVPLMNKSGRIVFITSIHGERVELKMSAYAMAKAALNQYCRSLALELAPLGILVNAIAPGFIDTPMSIVNGINELEGDWFRLNYVEGHHLPLKRAGKPQEIAGVISFLIGPDASYITGQIITVDGGLTITF